MSNTTGGTTPAGWYPVAPGSTQLRWWDGSAWTEHVHEQAPVLTQGVLQAPEGTNPNTVWAWIIAISPLFGLASVLTLDLRSYFQQIVNTQLAGGTPDPTSSLQIYGSPSYLLAQGLGLAIYLLTALLCAVDYRQLSKMNVPRPFHWAWSFLGGGLLYVIGRTVIVRRRTGRGFAPLWVFIAAYVVYFVIASVYLFSEMSGIFSQLARIPTS